MNAKVNTPAPASVPTFADGIGRADFPILSRTVYGRPLVYLDNAATTQKPRQVVEAMVDEYYNANANVHRGVHYLSRQATDLHEQARDTVRQFIHARSTTEIIFTRGTTEAINLLASCMARRKHGGEVIVSAMEHHSNIVPWQLNGFKLKVIPMTDEGELDLDAYDTLFTPETRAVSVAQVSNVLGVVNPIDRIISIAHSHGVPVVIDGAQSTPHMAVDMIEMDCDYFAFSSHKIYGPTGVGVLYGKEQLLDQLPPYQGGGEMIRNVSFDHTTFNDLPYRFEAGTPDYIGTHALAVALDYVSGIGIETIHRHEQDLTHYAIERLSQIQGMHIYAPDTLLASASAGPVSFNIRGIHHLDLGTLLDRLGIAVRTGHHCAEPLMHRLGAEGTVRASFALYNTRADIDTLAAGIERVCHMF